MTSVEREALGNAISAAQRLVATLPPEGHDNAATGRLLRHALATLANDVRRVAKPAQKES